MTKKHTKNIMQQGSLMIEALALLGLITMVTPVMYKKAAERTTELQDINVATQMRTLTEALDNFVRNNYEAIKNEVTVDAPKIVNAKDDNNIAKGVKAYLPAGFDITQSKYFDAENLKFSIKREDITDISGNTKNVYTSAVLAPSLTPLQLNRAAKIASMIGINGGTIKGTKFEGTQGSWNADPMSWFNVDPATLKLGSLMSISSEVIAEGPKSDTSKLLYRVYDSDPGKNTMKTNLLMDGNDIKGIKTLFGDNNELYIGDDTKETNLFVKGTTQIAKTLTINSGGIIVDNGGAEITGNVTLKNNASIDGSLEVKGDTALKSDATIGGTLNVTGATTLNSTLNVTGDTTLAKLTAGDTTLVSLAVTNDATIGHDLKVTNDATIKHDLTVDNDATIRGDLNIGGSLISDKLHAKTRLTVGGEDPENPTVMNVDENEFKVENASGNINLGGSVFEVTHSSGNKITLAEENLDASVGAANMQLKSSGAVDIQGKQGSFQIGGNNSTKSQLSLQGINGGEIGIETSNLRQGIWHDQVYLKKNYTTTGGDIIEQGSLTIDEEGMNLKYENSNISMQSETVNIGIHDKTVLESNSDYILGYTKLAAPAINGASIILDTNTMGVKSSNIYIDNDGFAIGNDLSGSNGNREDVMSDPLSAADSQKVIISRKGYIELAAPKDTDPNGGTKAGFIRARRLVSDVPYYGNEDFHGNASTEGRYDYYQVNPAYTSVMNDIKLASRGGARLSDILSDYVIKGIYVADNTYNAGYHKGAYIGYESDGVTLIKDGDIDAEGLVWDMIPITNGSPEDGVIQSSDAEGATNCAEEGPGKCKIYSCTRADCVASPWMGFVPRPQCPKNYLGVITNNPIRWRMSEVYHLTDKAKEWLNVPEDTTPENYNKIISDLDEDNDSSSPDSPTRFSNYFKKHTNPRKAIFSIPENNEPDATSNKHTHETPTPPVTFQTNTWLNSSVSPHYSNDGSDVVDGWHILMGFLYRPTDYSALLDDMGYTGADPDSLHWNIFPVYANEMASIVTTYCAFAPTFTNNWDADNPNSPVLNYNQLNANTYRDPNSFDRNPVNVNTGKGTGWEAQVNDPSLPYNDAW